MSVAVLIWSSVAALQFVHMILMAAQKGQLLLIQQSDPSVEQGPFRLETMSGFVHTQSREGLFDSTRNFFDAIRLAHSDDKSRRFDWKGRSNFSVENLYKSIASVIAS